jgi:hypothetical protein
VSIAGTLRKALLGTSGADLLIWLRYRVGDDVTFGHVNLAVGENRCHAKSFKLFAVAHNFDLNKQLTTPRLPAAGLLGQQLCGRQVGIVRLILTDQEEPLHDVSGLQRRSAFVPMAKCAFSFLPVVRSGQFVAAGAE